MEWRVDLFEDAKDLGVIAHCAAKLRVALKDKLLLITFRTKAEGGNVSLTHEEYLRYIRTVLDTDCADLIDIEFFTAGTDLTGLIEDTHTAGAPRTVDTSADSSSAAEIESGTQISLSGQDSDTCIFYLPGEKIDDVKMEVSRLFGNESWTPGKQEDGSYYYKAGKRWYQIKANKKIKQYDSSAEEKFYNDTDDPQTRYVGAVAIGSSSSPSSLVTYVYKVKPAEPVSEPEASLPK